MHAIKHLYSAPQAYQAWLALWPQIKADVLAGHRLEIEVRPERRSTAASARFHAICADLASARFPWFGYARTGDEWKVLLISGHAVATKQGANVLPGIEGEMVNVRESSALMSKARSASLIEYSEAFCIANDVPLRDPQSIEAA